MLKVIAGSVVGGLVAGTIALVAGAAGGNSRDVTSDLAYPSIVQCEPYQQATMRRSIVDGREVSTLSCVTAVAPVASPAAYVQPGAAYASLTAPMAPEPVAAPRPAVVRERVVTREAPRANKRSWTKSALVIGGTSGAGAGIGALVGGKKGALIGAALGGGSGAIYEATKRK
jgi:hypothetical protein